MINRFEPDLLYFDDTALPLYPVSDAGLQIAAHFYNSNMARNNGKLDAVLFGKILNDEQKKSLVWDVERGAPDKIQDLPWQTCTCIGDWHYNDDVYEKDRYKSSKDVVQMLIDVVSKNGNLLLNIPMRGDGSIDEKERAIVEGIADWMEINGESIFGTRPWVVFGEGPSADSSNPINAQGFNEGKVKYTGKDIRFNYKESDKALFVSLLGQPENDINITRLAEGEGVHTIKDIQLLGSTETLQWKRNKAGLHITKPTVTPNDIAFVFKISYGE